MLLLLGVAASAQAAGSLDISNRFSGLNRFRSVRNSTDFIILHTTEGGDRSSLNRIRKRGLAHYVVMRNGRVHRVIRRQKVAIHAGRSMWAGIQNLDRRSIGIEVVGYHDKPITAKQVAALKELLSQLQKIYGIPDEKVLTHSMVAYGRPNRWHKKSHRGRKRCGMQFATTRVRRQLGLTRKPAVDPDVRAGRLIEADPYLARVLYGADSEPRPDPGTGQDNIITARRSAWYFAREDFDSPTTVYVFPGGNSKPGDEIRDWSMIPPGTKVLLDQETTSAAAPAQGPEFLTLGRNQSASKVAGKAHDDYSTVYVLPSGRIKRGDTMSERDFRKLPPGTRIFLGVEFAGKVTPRNTAFQICGPRYDDATTVYVFPSGRVKRGDAIREKGIPRGTLILVES